MVAVDSRSREAVAGHRSVGAEGTQRPATASYGIGCNRTGRYAERHDSENILLSLRELTVELTAFADGRIGRAAVQRWLVPFHVAAAPEAPDDEEPDSWTPDADDRALFWQLARVVEDESMSEMWQRRVVSQVLRCLEHVPDSGDTSELLPLILFEDRLAEVVGKHRAGVISRAGLLSVVSKRFPYDPELRTWLSNASPEILSLLCARLAEGDFVAVLSMFRLPPA